jgi:putative Mn2+ efflux pump MntP
MIGILIMSKIENWFWKAVAVLTGLLLIALGLFSLYELVS